LGVSSPQGQPFFPKNGCTGHAWQDLTTDVPGQFPLAVFALTPIGRFSDDPPGLGSQLQVNERAEPGKVIHNESFFCCVSNFKCFDAAGCINGANQGSG
jgi:hypothetical protein